MTAKETQSYEERKEEIRLRRRRNYIGVFAGIGLGLVFASFIPWLRDQVDFFNLILWSGAIGIAAANIGQFAKAGAALTRSENNWLNFLVGLGLPVIFLLLVYFLVQFISN